MIFSDKFSSTIKESEWTSGLELDYPNRPTRKKGEIAEEGRSSKSKVR
jgi:hypothetical protein